MFSKGALKKKAPAHPSSPVSATCQTDSALSNTRGATVFFFPTPPSSEKWTVNLAKIGLLNDSSVILLNFSLILYYFAKQNKCTKSLLFFLWKLCVLFLKKNKTSHLKLICHRVWQSLSHTISTIGFGLVRWEN